MNKTLIALCIAAALSACSSEDNAPETTGANVDPITGQVVSSAGNAAESSTEGAVEGQTQAPADDAVASGNADGNAAAMLSSDNATQVINEAFAVYTGAAYGEQVFALPPYPGLFDMDYEPDSTVTRDDVCENGGTASLSSSYSGERVSISERQAAFDNCQSGAMVIDGEVQVLNTDNASIASSGLTVTSDASTKRFQGGAGYGDGNNYGGSDQRWWNASEVSWSVTDGDAQIYRIDNATSSYQTNGPFMHTLSGGFTFTDSTVNIDRVTVATVSDFTHENTRFDAPGLDQWSFQAGSMRLSATDGSSILVEAANGDDSSARITIAHAGESESYDQPWSELDSYLKAGPSLTR